MSSLKVKLEGYAMRVPTPNVSVVDFVALTEKNTTTAEVNAVLKAAAEGPRRQHGEGSELVRQRMGLLQPRAGLDSVLAQVDKMTN